MPLLIVAILLAASTASAQSQRASISGEVTDAGGAVTVGAKVTAVNADTNVTATVMTNTAGIYLISNLEIGSYSVTVEHPGFRRYRENGIVLQTAETLGLNVKLEVGSVSETVTVVANAAVLEDKTSVITQTFEPEQVADLPLGDRRTMNLANLAAGAVFVD